MSINMDSPQTVLEKVDALSNLIEQMKLSHMMKDEAKFNSVHQQASMLAFDLLMEIQGNDREDRPGGDE